MLDLKPVWHQAATQGDYGRLEEDLDVDVCVVGAGITGVTLASWLRDHGKSVAVLEMRAIGLGATAHTSGHLTAYPDVDLATLHRRFGEDAVRTVLHAGLEAITYIEGMCEKHQIPCGFERVDGFRYSEAEVVPEVLVEEASIAGRLGIPGATLLHNGPLPFMRHAVCYPRQAQFHPVRYVQALARMAHADGARIFEGSRVTSVDEEADRCIVHCEDHVVTCRRVVYATHTPLGTAVSVQTRVAPYTSYCLGLRLEGPAPQGLYWDMEDPYHYVRALRFEDGSEILVVGGEDHKSGQQHDSVRRFGALESWARRRFSVQEVAWRWAWPVFQPVDGLPYIGLQGHHRAIYCATGYAGNGLTFGTFAAMRIGEAILGRTDAPGIFSPRRVDLLASSARFVTENANVAAHFVGDRLSNGDVSTVDDVRPGSGALVRVDGSLKACFRDRGGVLHVTSARCPHLGGTVQWNEAAGTWDCPLHGSRFLARGKLLAGPAVNDLEIVGELEKRVATSGATSEAK